MIYEDVRNAIIADPTLSAIVGNRVYSKKPIQGNSSPYIQVNREARQRNIVSDGSRLRFTCFSKDTDILENMADGLIDLFEGQKSLTGTLYYEVAFLNQVDNDQKLENGMYWAYLDFNFKKIY